MRLMNVVIGVALIILMSSSFAQEDKTNAAPLTTPQAEKQEKLPLPVTITAPIKIERDKPSEPDWTKLDCTKTQSHDESDLCEQRRMAEAAEHNLYWAKMQVWVGAASAALITLSLVFAGWSALTAARATQIAEKHMVASERPWISVLASIDGSLVIKDHGGRLSIKFAMTNHGKSPALNVEVEYKLLGAWHNAFDEQVKIKDRAKKRTKRKIAAHKIFPSHTFNYIPSIPITKEDIARDTSDFTDQTPTHVSLAIVGCVVYNSALDDENHITEFLYYIGLRDPLHPKAMLAFDMTQDSEIFANQIKIELSFGSGDAD